MLLSICYSFIISLSFIATSSISNFHFYSCVCLRQVQRAMLIACPYSLAAGETAPLSFRPMIRVWRMYVWGPLSFLRRLWQCMVRWQDLLALPEKDKCVYTHTFSLLRMTQAGCKLYNPSLEGQNLQGAKPYTTKHGGAAGRESWRFRLFLTPYGHIGKNSGSRKTILYKYPSFYSAWTKVLLAK